MTIESDEAAFTRAILSDPKDTTARLVFADWLDEHGRHVQAKYLREIRAHKFVRLVFVSGGWALTPQWAEQRGRRVPDDEAFDLRTGEPDSPRYKYWRRRMRRGWRVPAHVKTMGYSMAVEWFGVYVSEYLHGICPHMEYWE